MYDYNYKRSSAILQSYIGLTGTDDPWIGEKINNVFGFYKMNLLTNVEAVSGSDDLQILEKNKTNSKKKMYSVKNLSHFFGYNTERIFGM